MQRFYHIYGIFVGFCSCWLAPALAIHDFSHDCILDNHICHHSIHHTTIQSVFSCTASEQISRGGTLKLYDSEEDEVYELTRDKLLDGIKKYCEDAERPYDIMHEGVNSVRCSTGEYGLDCCMVDAVEWQEL